MPTYSDPTHSESEPGRCWTTTNVGENTPEVMSPLCWSVWLLATELGSRGAWIDLGILRKSDLKVPANPNELTTSCFYGRQALNVDRVRELVGAVPGSSADDFERDLLGMVRDDAPKVEESMRRAPVMALKMPVVVAGQRRRVSRLAEDRIRWWRQAVLDDTGAEPRRALRDAADRFVMSQRCLVIARTLMQAAHSGIARLSADPELTLQVISGLGDVAETTMLDDLWLVSRRRLTRDEFIARHGFHGPAEGNPIGHSWRENPEHLDRMVLEFADRADDQRPGVRARRSAGRNAEAVQQLIARIPAYRSAQARLLVKTMARQVRYLETTKACNLMAIDGVRASARRLGQALVRAGEFDEPDDAFYLTLDELVADLPDDHRGLLAFRRERRAYHATVELSTGFTGTPVPVHRCEQTPMSGTRLIGKAASSGVAEGVARVITDPTRGENVQPGEILVCRTTDPSWAPQFALADGLVIEIGGPTSHGAIVARELGVPCVIGVGDVSRLVETGDLIHVDGTTGVVTITGHDRHR